MSLPDRVKLPFAFDPAGLASDLARLTPEDWISHFVTQNYEGNWDVAPLRGVAGASHPVKMIYSDPTAKDFADGPLLALCPHIRAALSSFACQLQAVRLMRLTPGSVIKEHTDHDLDVAHGMARIHVPVVTNPGVTFELNRRPVDMEPGSAWYLRLSDPHRVRNEGTADRIHLVLDAVVNDWLRDTLFQAAAVA